MKSQTRLLAVHCVIALVISLCFAQSSLAATFTITRTGAEGGQELAQAVFNANTQTNEAHTITFSSNVKSVLLPEELTIRSSIIIDGSGAEISAASGSGTFRLFRITNGRTTFNRLTLTGGRTSGNGGAVEVAGTNASAEFNNCTLWGNQAGGVGGAVCITDGSVREQTTFTHCTIAGNTAESGGGIGLVSGAASTYASIIIGNGSGDISGSVQTYDTINGTDYATSDVLLTNDAGLLGLSEANGSYVLKLAPGSPARDAITSENSYTLNIDEAGTTRPQLYGFDLGAYEALPVSVDSVAVAGNHYMQVGTTEQFSVSVTPHDASRNVNAYPPDGIEWTTLNTYILSVDNTGLVSALNAGEGYITAIFHGWDGQGNTKEVRSESFYVRVGTATRQPPVITMTEIADVTMTKNEHKTITPSVAISENEYPVTPSAGVNYQLSAEVLSSGVVSATTSGDSVILMAWDNPGSCDVRVTAITIPAGTSTTRNLHVTVTDQGVGRSGGGCNSGTLSLAGVIMLAFIYRSPLTGRKGRR